jgi:hypothetical protein
LNRRTDRLPPQPDEKRLYRPLIGSPGTGKARLVLHRPSLALLEALIRHRLDQPVQMRRALGRAQRWVDAMKGDRETAGFVPWSEISWQERAALGVLLREAAGLSDKEKP